MNRAPGPSDYWWKRHQSTCGGTYHKIKEPPGYVDRRRRKNKTKSKSNRKNKLQTDSKDHEVGATSIMPGSGRSLTSTTDASLVDGAEATLRADERKRPQRGGKRKRQAKDRTGAGARKQVRGPLDSFMSRPHTTGSGAVNSGTVVSTPDATSKPPKTSGGRRRRSSAGMVQSVPPPQVPCSPTVIDLT